MRTQYSCGLPGRVKKLQEAGPVLNGIDFVEVEDGQTRIDVHFVHDLSLIPAAGLKRGNVEIRGGVRVRDPRVKSVTALGEVLSVEVEGPGDFATYRLRLVQSAASDRPPDGIDPALSEIEFSFKVDCPNPFDCRTPRDCRPEQLSDPPIDYLAKDYTSFRRLMLDRLSALLPDWKERSPADLWVTLVELVAFRADELSYFQDAVATEAYLGTARRRTSIRRHARLLDYPFHEGLNARAWIVFKVKAAAEGRILPGCDPSTGLGGTVLLTHASNLGDGAVVGAASARDAVESGAQVFETLEDVELHESHNRIRLHTWGDEECCLPKGATRASLRNDGLGPLQLRSGHVVVLEEEVSPETGRGEDADRAHRHAVRLTSVQPIVDPLEGLQTIEIRWDPRDALPFSLCISKRIKGVLATDLSVVRGNVALADHGRTVPEEPAGEELKNESDEVRWHPLLNRTLRIPVTQQGRVREANTETPVLVDVSASAAAVFDQSMEDVRPAIDLRDPDGETWTVRPDLLSSDRFSSDFVVEVEDDGRAYLRFGDGTTGRRPRSGTFRARYRVGGGDAGNVGAEAIMHITVDFDGFEKVYNPMAARGGTNPHPIPQARLYAPQAFRRQERAVTTDDYSVAAERHPDVQRAVATRRWTGSWHTMFVTTDRSGGGLIDPEFEDRLRSFLERFRLAGHDLEIDAPRFVPLDLAFDVCIRRGYFASDVEQRLLQIFSARRSPDGEMGLFHPDRLTFGTPIYLSALIARTMELPGVSQVLPRRFQRWGRTSAGELAAGAIRMGRLEIGRLDNDPNAPENGRIEFRMIGAA